MKFLQWITALISVSKFKMSHLDRRITKLQRAREKAEERLELQNARLQRMHEELQKELQNTHVELKNTKLLLRSQEETIDGLREQLETAEKITIPGLVASSETMMARWERETQILSIKTALEKGSE